MAGLDQFSDITGLDDLCQFMDTYCISGIVPECKFDPIVQIILDLPHEEIISLTSEETSSYAFKLHSYCIFLRKDLDKNLAKVVWCEEILNRIVSKSWNDFDAYMKYEVRRHAAIAQDTFATKVEKARIYIGSAIQQIRDKVEDISKMANILENLARKKSYERS